MGRSARAALLFTALSLAGLSACGASGGGGRPAQASGGGVGLKQIGRFDEPVYVSGAPGYPQLLFVVEQGGRVEVLRRGRRLGHAFLDISGLVQSGGERGLLSIAFPPDYPRSRRFYVYYTDGGGNIRVDEFKRKSATRAARGSRRAVVEIPHPVNANHNGGQLQFLGSLLYLGTGDGGRAEIYAYGLRNPFRFSFDRSHGGTRIAIGDVGQGRFEELDYLTVGAARSANFGWDAFEGFAPYLDENSGTPDPGGTTKPIFAYPHSRGGSCSIIGGYVVADPRLPSLRGRYVYADLCEGELRSLVPHLHGAGGDRRLGLHVSTPTSFGEDNRGRIYVSSLEGPVYRLVPR